MSCPSHQSMGYLGNNAKAWQLATWKVHVLTDTPITTNGVLFTVQLTELPIAHGLSLDQPNHQYAIGIEHT